MAISFSQGLRLGFVTFVLLLSLGRRKFQKGVTLVSSVNHGCAFCPACWGILSLIYLTLVVFLSPECSLRSVGDLRGDLAREEWGKEGIEDLRFFCAFHHFFLTIPVQQWAHHAFGLPSVAAGPEKSLLPFTFLNSSGNFSFTSTWALIFLIPSLHACPCSSWVACACFHLHVFSWHLSSRLSCEVWVGWKKPEQQCATSVWIWLIYGA